MEGIFSMTNSSFNQSGSSNPVYIPMIKQDESSKSYSMSKYGIAIPFLLMMIGSQSDAGFVYGGELTMVLPAVSSDTRQLSFNNGGYEICSVSINGDTIALPGAYNWCFIMVNVKC